MKFGICNETYQNWTFEKTCADIAETGYDGVEIAPFTLNPDPGRLTERDARSAAETARRAGLEVIGLHWLMVRPEGPPLHLTTPDAELRRRTVEYALHLTRLCGVMGGRRIMVWGSPRQRNIAEGQAYDEAFAHARDALRTIADTAEQLNVVIALEPLSPAETNFLTTAAETIRLIQAVGSPSVRLHLDVKAMSSEKTPIPQIIAASRAHTVHFHANDANLRGPGFGPVDFVPIARALKESGYRDYVSVEVFNYEPDPQTIARQSLSYLKRTFAQAGAIDPTS